jgi:hypothetical protein
MEDFRGIGWRSSCSRCVGSKFVCDEHRGVAVPTDTPLPTDLVQRMEALVRGMVRPNTQHWSGDYTEARAIYALLPNPDLPAARELVLKACKSWAGSEWDNRVRNGEEDGSDRVNIALAAIEYGRSLARAGDA